MSDMLKLDASAEEKAEFRVRALAARVKELEAVLMALVAERGMLDEAEGYLDGVRLIETDFTPNLQYIRGRGARIASTIGANRKS